MHLSNYVVIFFSSTIFPKDPILHCTTCKSNKGCSHGISPYPDKNPDGTSLYITARSSFILHSFVWHAVWFFVKSSHTSTFTECEASNTAWIPAETQRTKLCHCLQPVVGEGPWLGKKGISLTFHLSIGKVNAWAMTCPAQRQSKCTKNKDG